MKQPIALQQLEKAHEACDALYRSLLEIVLDDTTTLSQKAMAADEMEACHACWKRLLARLSDERLAVCRVSATEQGA